MSKNLVYSTDSVLNNSIKIERKKTHTNSLANNSSSNLPDDKIIRIHRETKGRKGKGVSIIKGLNLNEADLKNLAKKIKQHCGTGGTIKQGNIEIQTDQREKIKTYLEAQSYTAKLAGS